MSENPSQSGAAGPAGGDLQFEQAEFAGAATGALSCAACKRPIDAEYFQINGHITCPACCAGVEAALSGGSSAARMLKAAVAGLLAAVVGAGLYWGVAAVTGYELGLVAIAVGLLVGGAVRWGSEGRGGPAFQVLAILLTYLSIATAYFGFVLKQLANEHSGGALLQIWSWMPWNEKLSLLSLGLQMPVRVGIESPMGLIIVGIALYEAWKISRGARLQVDGPYQAPAPRPTEAGGAA